MVRYDPKCRFPRPSKRTALLAFAAVLLFVISYWAEQWTRPTVQRVLQYECRRFALNAFSEVADANTEESPEHYQGLYQFQYGPDGSISAVTVDAYAVNRIQSVLSNQITQRLLEVEQTPLVIPLGTLTGIQALVGRGPDVRFYIEPESYVDTEVFNRLESTGINQTRLSLYVRFTMSLSVVLGGYGTTVEVSNDQYLGEVLLVGEIPSSYWNSAA